MLDARTFFVLRKMIAPALPEWVKLGLENNGYRYSLDEVEVALANLVKHGKAEVVNGRYFDVLPKQASNCKAGTVNC